MRLGVEAALVGGKLVPGDLELVDGRVARVGIAAEAGKGIAVPGFVDLQVNGFAGVDFFDAGVEDYRKAGQALLETGVTSYQPTLITSPEERLTAALAQMPRRHEPGQPRILGAHVEGPFLSAKRIGTHPLEWRRDPDAALLGRLLEAGPVRHVTLAPELPGADELIGLLLARGISVSFGHTDATARQANAGFDRGVRTVTHLFNAMRPLSHREPGIVGAALSRDDVIVQIIADGVHVDFEVVKVVWRSKPGGVALVTDALSAAGAGDGTFTLGDVEVVVRDGVARGPGGMLAGSVLTMIEAVRNLHAVGATLEQALGAATAIPASIIGESEAGRIAPGTVADIVVLDDNLEIQRVLVGGEACVVV
ncbi:MAG: N-acetylglucosamine-6-phosphate deacetylase [Gaiellaceae bacterium]